MRVHHGLQKPSSTHPASFKSARQGKWFWALGVTRTFLIPQLTKEPLPALVGRSNTTPSRYSESSSTRMWWGLSRGLSSPKTAQESKEKCKYNCSATPSLSGPAHHGLRSEVGKSYSVLCIPSKTSKSSGRGSQQPRPDTTESLPANCRSSCFGKKDFLKYLFGREGGYVNPAFLLNLSFSSSPF